MGSFGRIYGVSSMLWALFYVLRVHREVSKVDKNPIVVVSIVQDERDVRYQGECSGSHV